MNVCPSNGTTHQESGKRRNEDEPSHHGSMVLTAQPRPPYAAYEREDYANQNAVSKHIIVVLYEIESEVRCHIDIEGGSPQCD